MGQVFSDKIGGTVLPADSSWLTTIRVAVTTANNSITEIGRLFPDSVLFGSLLLFFMTQNLPYGIFALFMIETSLLHKVVSFLFDKTSGGNPSSTNSATKATKNTDAACISGFRGGRIEFERSFTHTYPSSPMFFLGSIASYLVLVNAAFKETMDEMGQDWSSRFGFGIAMIIIWCAAAIVMRGLYGCDHFSEIGLAFLIGAVLGGGLYIINTKLFGMEGVNFLGLPYLVNKTETGNPLYVCMPKHA